MPQVHCEVEVCTILSIFSLSQSFIFCFFLLFLFVFLKKKYGEKKKCSQAGKISRVITNLPQYLQFLSVFLEEF